MTWYNRTWYNYTANINSFRYTNEFLITYWHYTSYIILCIRWKSKDGVGKEVAGDEIDKYSVPRFSMSPSLAIS